MTESHALIQNPSGMSSSAALVCFRSFVVLGCFRSPPQERASKVPQFPANKNRRTLACVFAACDLLICETRLFVGFDVAAVRILQWARVHAE